MSGTFLYGANVSANGIRQHYRRYGGRGPALVLIPGITSPAVTWSFVSDRFGRHFDTYTLDIRGRGLSSTGPELDYGLDAMADDVSGFIQALGLEGVTLVGHSMGARIAIRSAVRNDRGIARLALIDPPVSGPGRRPYPSGLAWYVDSIRLAAAGMDIDAMRRFCPTWTDEQLRLRAEWLHTCYEPAIVAAYEGFHTDDIHADMRRLTCTALLMVAGRGGVIRPEDEEELRTLCPSLVVRRVESAGHMIPWDDVDGFFGALDGFLPADAPL